MANDLRGGGLANMIRQLVGLGPREQRGVPEVAMAATRARQERERATSEATAWDRDEREAKRRHAYWEDMLGPPGPNRREANRDAA